MAKAVISGRCFRHSTNFVTILIVMLSCKCEWASSYVFPKTLSITGWIYTRGNVLLPKHQQSKLWRGSSRRRYNKCLYSTSSTTVVEPLQYVFGYGSLICPNSRCMTAPEQAMKIATPVVVNGVERIWSKRTVRGMTAMGVQLTNDMTVQCVGVLLRVNHTELIKFDEREVGYQRRPIELSNVDTVSFLSHQQHYSHPDHQPFMKSKNENTDIDLKVWIYVPNEIFPPSFQYPIAQSYVDTILRGCFSISDEFASEFVTTTKGWHPNEFHDDKSVSNIFIDENNNHDNTQILGNGDDEDVEQIIVNSSHWVDDRVHPIYPRGDPNWSIRNAVKVDQLLLSMCPQYLKYRKPRYRSSTTYNNTSVLTQ
jgi:hypothetical protein